eukprot:scaffold271754_cov28-Tisochrysis_lutea.AAC.3
MEQEAKTLWHVPEICRLTPDEHPQCQIGRLKGDNAEICSKSSVARGGGRAAPAPYVELQMPCLPDISPYFERCRNPQHTAAAPSCGQPTFGSWRSSSDAGRACHQHREPSWPEEASSAPAEMIKTKRRVPSVNK